MSNLHFEALQPDVVLGVAAHPDDLDFSASGSMAKFIRNGAKAYYLILTDGGAGTEDRSITSEKLREIRQAEQRNAGKVLGLSDVYFCKFKDGTLQNTLEVKREVVRIIRKVRPEVVVTMDPSVLYSPQIGFINHPDHRAAGQAALDAVFPLARDHMSFPELLEEGLEPHKTKTILLMNLNEHNFAVDVSDTLDLKFKALAEHASQVPNLAEIKERFTQRAAQLGSPYGFRYAETFIRVDIHG
jgi:LmbE family N-acetylglucosaminyl deacetylase